MQLQYDNQFLFVFDEFVPKYESGTLLGLVEQSDEVGWLPRRFFVANGGLMPLRFFALYQGAMQMAVPSAMLAAAMAFLSLQ